jgi:signal transduction histidine kinase
LDGLTVPPSLPILDPGMTTLRRRRLQWLFGALSLTATLLLLALGGIALRSVAVSHRSATDAARADLAALADASTLQAMLYQKGFVSEYFLTGDRHWLDELQHSRAEFEHWLASVKPTEGDTADMAHVTAVLVAEYGRYDAERARAVTEFDAGHKDVALATLVSATGRVPRLRELALTLIHQRRDEVLAQLQRADRSWEHALWGLGLTIALAIVAALAGGYLLARRVAQPLYDLVLRAESAMGGARAEVLAHDEIGALSEHVTLLARRLVQAEKMSALGEMATAVAHELLNPLTGVKTALQLLARTNKAAEVTETVDAVDVEVRRVEQMARRLMHFARPATPQPERIELDALLPQVLSAARGEADARGLRIVPRLGGLRVVRADPDLLTQVLINLVVNACQATATGGGDIEVRAHAEGSWQIVEVIDRGLGLAPDVATRLFTPFTTNKPEGHGLGLAISQNIALAHGGRIEARANEPGPGMTFSLWLPGAAS